MYQRREEERRRPLNFRRRGFTDRLYIVNLKITWGFVAVCIIITLLSGVLNITDLSIISIGLPSAFAELSIHTGFIIWKAKNENISKYGNNVADDISL